MTFETYLTKRPWLLPLLLLLGTFLFYSQVYPLNWTDGIIRGLDLNEYTYPYFDFMVREVQEHHSLPLWNPHQYGGFSLVGAGEVNPFYPPNWLIFLLNTRRAVAVNLILHGFIGMWGTAVLARRWQTSYLGALMAGLLWGGSGFIGARLYAGHYMILLPLAWLPWVLAYFMAAIQEKRWWYTGLGMGAYGLLLLSGHPQIGFMTGVTLFLIAAYWVYCHPQEFRRTVLPLLLIGLVGGSLAAVQILPTLETTLGSRRDEAAENRVDFASRFSLPAQQITTLIFPHLPQNSEIDYSKWNFEELFGYIGLLALLAIPLLSRRHIDYYGLLLLLAGTGIVLGMAADGGVMRLLIQVMPILGVFRSLARWLLLTQLALACLAGLLITWLQNASAEERTEAISRLTRSWLPNLILLCFVMSIVISLGHFLESNDRWKASLVVSKTALMLLFLTLALRSVQNSYRALPILLLVALIDVWSVSMPLISVGNFRTYGDFWYELEEVLPPETAGEGRILIYNSAHRAYASATGRGYYDVFGYEQLGPAAYEQWLATRDPFSLSFRVAGLEYVARRDPYSDQYLDPDTGMFDLIYQREGLYLYRYQHPIPRAFLAREVVIEPDDAVILEYFQTGRRDEIFTVFLDEAAPCMEPGSPEETAAEITSYRPNEVHIQVEAEQPSLLFLSDRYASGWEATVNGETAKIYRADTLFRGVCVPAGSSEVVFKYRPLSLYVGGAISVISWLALIGCLFYIRRRHGTLSL